MICLPDQSLFSSTFKVKKFHLWLGLFFIIDWFTDVVFWQNKKIILKISVFFISSYPNIYPNNGSEY